MSAEPARHLKPVAAVPTAFFIAAIVTDAASLSSQLASIGGILLGYAMLAVAILTFPD